MICKFHYTLQKYCFQCKRKRPKHFQNCVLFVVWSNYPISILVVYKPDNVWIWVWIPPEWRFFGELQYKDNNPFNNAEQWAVWHKVIPAAKKCLANTSLGNSHSFYLVELWATLNNFKVGSYYFNRTWKTVKKRQKNYHDTHLINKIFLIVFLRIECFQIRINKGFFGMSICLQQKNKQL